MKKKNLILWTCLISITILIVLFCVLFKFSKEKTYPVFLLNQNVPSGCRIERNMIRSVSLPQSSILPNICKKTEDIIGKVLARDMENGDLLSLKDLQIFENGVVYPSIAQGNVLYTLALNAEDANGWWITKGNKINLLIYDMKMAAAVNPSIENESVGNPDSQNEAGLGKPIQQIESVKIVRIMDEAGNEISQDGKPPKMVCLELSNAQAQELFQAENEKKVKLIAKNSNEIE